LEFDDQGYIIVIDVELTLSRTLAPAFDEIDFVLPWHVGECLRGVDCGGNAVESEMELGWKFAVW
jgi:hypothetical protein